MNLKNFLLILILLFCSFLLTGCNNSNGVEAKAYVIAVGLDKRRHRYAKAITSNCCS